MVLLNKNRLTHHLILSLGQASSQFLVGLMLVLTPDNNHFTSSSNSLSWPGHSSSIMMADASIVDSLNFLIRKKVTTADRVDEEDISPSLFDNVYSFAKGAVAGVKAQTVTQSKLQQDLQVSFQGTSQNLGQWDLLGFSGVSAMHATLIPNTNKIVFLEKVEKSSYAHFNEHDPKSMAWSVEFDIEESTFRPLHTKTNMFCSAGGYRPDGVSVFLFLN